MFSCYLFGVFEVRDFTLGFWRFRVSVTGFRVHGFVIRGFCRFVVSSTEFQLRGF